ncbi:DNA-binding response regulator [Sphingomonas koreensis]|nr:DNA-binding response regulator [Sphingomonas koreensis]
MSGTVHIVDDDDALRAALGRLVRSAGLDAIGHCSASGLGEAAYGDRPRCILLDIRLEGENGLSVQESLRVGGNTAPVIFLTGYGTIPMTVQAMRAGAAEFLTKPVNDDVLLSAIFRALEHDALMAQRRQIQADLDARLASLTDREGEVMRLAIGGLMNKQIAGELGITEITAKVHKRRVMEKMSARSLPDLVRMAEQLGIAALRSR